MVKKQKPKQLAPKLKETTPIKSKKKSEVQPKKPLTNKISPAKRVRSPLSQKSGKLRKNTPKVDNESEGI